jgi:hypothetical protein
MSGLLCYKSSYSYRILTINCPCRSVDVSYPYPPLRVLFHPGGLLILLLTEVWKDGIVQVENRQLVLQKGFIPYPQFTLNSIPHAWIGSCMNSSVPSLMLMSYSTVLLLPFFSPALSFLLLWGEG